MNIPISVLKSNYLSPEKIENQQTLAKKYFKQLSKTKNNTQPQQKQSLKDEIISWFFSFDLFTKLILSSIENIWLTNILHQLYIHQKNNYNQKFMYRGEEGLTEFIPGLLPQNMTVINSNNNEAIYCYLNYFSCKEENKYNSKDKLVLERQFVNEIKFYKTEENVLSDNFAYYHKYSDYFSLSTKICSDEALFRRIFDTFSNGQAFNNLINCEKEQKSKLYFFQLPNWINNKEYYSLTEYFVASFEQVITVRYLLDKQENFKKSKFENFYLNKLLNEKKDLTEYFKREFKNDTNKLLETLNGRKLIEEIHKDYKVKEIVKNRSSRWECYPLLYNCIIDNDHLSCYELERNLKNYFNSLSSEEEVIDCLLFAKLDNLFTYDNFLLKRIYEGLVDLYAQKNAFELINDENEEKVNTKKSKKKKRKNTKNFEDKPVEIEEDKQSKLKEEDIDIEMGMKKSAFSFIKKSNINNNQYVMKEFMGSMMMTKIDNDIKDIVKEMVEKACDSISDEPVSNDYFDNDTAYSSANLSEIEGQYDKRKKKRKNNYVLYDIKAKEKKKSLPTESIKHDMKRERVQSTNVYPSNMLEITTDKQLITTPVKTNTTSNFQININSKLNFKQPVYPRTNSLYKYNYNKYCYNYDIHNYYMYNDHYYTKFHKYIISYSEKIEENLSSVKDIKMKIIIDIESMVKECLSSNVKLEIYGSFANGLSIESSDIDLALKCYAEEINLNIIKLTDHFKKTKKFEKINPIITASVPVIKLEINAYEFFDQPLSDNYKAILDQIDSDDLKKIKVDLTFGNVDIILQQVEYVRLCTLKHPEIIPITKIFKKLFRNKNLNQSFNGGLSSYSLFLIILAFVKIHRLNNSYINLAKLLFDMLMYYGNYYDFKTSLIDVKLDNPFVLYGESLEGVPIILDPITNLNVAKSSYKINEIKMTFFSYYQKFNDIRMKVETKKLVDAINILYEFLNGVN